MGTIKKTTHEAFEYFRRKYPRLNEDCPISEGQKLYGFIGIDFWLIDINPGDKFWDCPNALFYSGYIVVDNYGVQIYSHP